MSPSTDDNMFRIQMRYYVNYGQGWQSFEGHQSYEGTDILHMLASRMFEMWALPTQCFFMCKQ